MNHRQHLKATFGGSWDGAQPEIHGLVELGDAKLKVELLYSRARKIWNCSVFNKGACVGQASGDEPVATTRLALETCGNLPGND